VGKEGIEKSEIRAAARPGRVGPCMMVLSWLVLTLTKHLLTKQQALFKGLYLCSGLDIIDCVSQKFVCWKLGPQ
jgi:hypothetical protein